MNNQILSTPISTTLKSVKIESKRIKPQTIPYFFSTINKNKAILPKSSKKIK